MFQSITSCARLVVCGTLALVPFGTNSQQHRKQGAAPLTVRRSTFTPLEP